MSSKISKDRLWQKALLPLMVITLIALTIFFIVTSYIEFRDFKGRLNTSSQKQEEILPALGACGDSTIQDERIIRENKESGLEYVKWRTSALLERETLNRRYNHSLSLISTQMWTRYLGFLTGMILAIVGAVFILGKLREEMSELGSESSGIKVNLKSTSPGIILAVLGTILLVTALVVKSDVRVDDGNLYLNRQQNTSSQPPANVEAAKKN